jgi:hypothetical protein
MVPIEGKKPLIAPAPPSGIPAKVTQGARAAAVPVATLPAAARAVSVPNASGTGASPTLFSDHPAIEATSDARLAFITDRLSRFGVEATRIRSLDTHAQDGLYLLCITGVDPRHIAQFLNRSLSDPAQVLELITFLYDAQVTGFEKAFQPSAIDEKLLSVDRHRIRSTFIELFHALQSSLLVVDAKVQLYSNFKMDWRNLSPEFQSSLNGLLPQLPVDLRQHYADQTTVEVDAVVAQNGSRWILEVKSSTGIYNPSGEELAKLKFQALRLAMVARKQGLAGVEYVIDANDISPTARQAIVQVLEPLRLPFIIRLSSSHESVIVHNGGLSYKAHARSLPLSRSRPLPPLPQQKAKAVEVVDADAVPEVDTIEALWADRSWRKSVGKILKQWGITSIEKTWADFVHTNAGSIRQISYEPRNLVGAIATSLESMPQDNGLKDLKSRFDVIRSAIKPHMSSEQLYRVVELAALVAGQPLTPVAGDVVEDVKDAEKNANFEQGLLQDSPAILGLLSDYHRKLGGELDVFESMMAELSTPVDLDDLREMLSRWDAHAGGLRVRVGREEMGLQAFVNRMRDLPAAERHTLVPELTDAMLVDLTALMARYERLSARLETEVAPAIESQRERAPVERVLRPIAADVAMELTERVLAEGELPVMRRPLRKKSSVRTTKTIKESELAEVVARHAARMALVMPDAGREIYFYPEEVDKSVKEIIRQIGGAADEPSIREMLIAALGAQHGGLAVRDIHNIIPKEFVRSDHVEIVSEWTGNPIDVTQAVQRLWREVPQEQLANVVRAVVIKGGRKVYFVNVPVLQAHFSRYLIPFLTETELVQILRGPNLDLFLLHLSGTAQLPMEFGLVGRVESGVKVGGLKIVPVAVLSEYSKHYFKLHFALSSEGLVLQSAKGTGARDLAESLVEQKLGRALEGVEKALVAARYGYPAESVAVSDVRAWFTGGGPTALQSWIPELGREFGVVGIVGSGEKIGALKIVPAAELSEYLHNFFKLNFVLSPEGLVLQSAKGTGVRNLTEPLVAQKLGRELDAVEKALVAARYGYLPEHVTLSDVSTWLKGDRQIALQPWIPEVGGEWGIVGRMATGVIVNDLKIISVAQLNEFPKKYFKLHFSSGPEGLVLQSAEGSNVRNLTEPLVEQKLGRELDAVEKALVAARNKYKAESVTLPNVSAWLAGSGPTVLQPWIPELGREFGVVGRAEPDGRVSGLKIVPVAELGAHQKGQFKLHFVSGPEGLVLQSAKEYGARDLAESMVGQKLGRDLEGIEKALLAARYGYPAESVAVSDVRAWFTGGGPTALQSWIPELGREFGMVGHAESGGKVFGLKIVSIAQLNEFQKKHFKLHFLSGPEGLILQSAEGSNVRDLTEPLVAQKLGRELDAVEKALLAARYGYPAESVAVSDVRAWFTGGGPTALQSWIPELGREFGVVGDAESGGKVFSLKIVSIAQLNEFQKKYFKLHFTSGPEGLLLQSARGLRVRSLVESVVEQKLGRELGGIEKALVAAHYGYPAESMALPDVSAWFADSRPTALQPWIPELDREFGVVGSVESGVRIRGLKIVPVANLSEYPKGYFRIHVQWAGDTLKLKSANGNGAARIVEGMSRTPPKSQRGAIELNLLAAPILAPIVGARKLFETTRTHAPQLQSAAEQTLRGGLVFFLGSLGADAFEAMRSGDWSRFEKASVKDLTTDYAALTIGGEAGRVATTAVVKHIPVKAMPTPFKSFAVRTGALTTGLALLNRIHSGEFHPDQLPHDIAVVMAAGGLVQGAGKVLKSMSWLRGAAECVKLTRAGRPTLGLSVVASAAEFTLIREINALELQMTNDPAVQKVRGYVLDLISQVAHLPRQSPDFQVIRAQLQKLAAQLKKTADTEEQLVQLEYERAVQEAIDTHRQTMGLSPKTADIGESHLFQKMQRLQKRRDQKLAEIRTQQQRKSVAPLTAAIEFQKGADLEIPTEIGLATDTATSTDNHITHGHLASLLGHDWYTLSAQLDEFLAQN